MREFTNKSLWDAENQDWLELYYIDGLEVLVDEYTEQLEVEESVTEEENYDCEDNELENRECDCPICQAEQEIKDEECFCEECVESMQNDAIEECLDIIFRGDACPSCLIDGVLKLAFKFKEIGRQEVKSEMYEFLDD